MKLKNEEKKPPTAACEPGAVVYDGICVTDGSNRENNYKGIINLYKERQYALQTFGKFLHRT